ncbi:MAG: threonine/serine exporter family protein [Anaerolineae bacterium]|nr:threonine/serine exporter family protein [Anaerolineae bacterium]
MSLLWLLLHDAFWSALAALGFAILFNVPMRTLPACALGGALGHVTRTLCIQMIGLSPTSATVFGATVVGFFGHYAAQRWQAPSTVFTVPGVIPMVPGSLAFQTMMDVIRISESGPIVGKIMLAETAVNALRTGLILAGLAVGVIAPRLMFFRQRPLF